MPAFKPKSAKKIKFNKKSSITLDGKHKEFLNEFSKDEQKLFLSSFYCFLNYKDNEFIVDFDNIWKWCGF